MISNSRLELIFLKLPIEAHHLNADSLTGILNMYNPSYVNYISIKQFLKTTTLILV